MLTRLKNRLAQLVGDIKSDNKQAVFIFILLFINMAYFLSRVLHDPNLVVAWLFATYLSALIVFRFKIYSLINIKLLWLVATLATLILIWSLFYDRSYLGDGANLYFRNVYLIMQKGHSGILQGSLMPYLSELVLGLVGKFLGYNIMFLLFGVASLANIYTSYLLYKKLGFNSFVTKSSLLILALSPTYIILSILEFKVELFLLFVSNLFLLTLVDAYKKPSVVTLALLGFLSGVSFLIKVSVLPLVLLPPLFLILWVVRKGVVSIRYTVGLLSGFFVSFLLVVMLWFVYTPTEMPFIGTIDLFGRTMGFIDLERHEDVLNQCSYESSHRDFSSWIYFKNELWLLIQPLQYLFLIGFYLNDSIITIGNPGLYVYFGIWLLPLTTYLLYKRGSSLKVWVYASCIPFVLILYFLSKTAFWYLFPAYPILATVVPILGDKYLKTRLSRDLFKFLLLCLSFVHLTYGFGLVLLYSPILNGLGSTDFKSVVHGMSKEAQNLSKDHYILDATQHIHITFLPFMDNYDERLVKSNFYFVSSKKDVDQMKDELLSKNIKYIIAKKDKLFDDWYIGCPFRNNEILFKFLEKHTRMVYDSKYIGEIYEIIGLED